MAYGIDLGTTNSCVAGWNDKMNIPKFFMNQVDGSTTTPSVVFFDPNDNNRILVGGPALASFMSNPSRVVRGIKRRIGDATSYDPRQSGLPNGTDPAAISALILKKMAQDVKRGYQQDVQDVVITVPAHFGLEQRAKTKLAGEYAGLRVLELIPEPTAAALSYGIDLNEDKNLIVYDLGGGTFDVTFVRIVNNGESHTFNYIALDGDARLGGMDWDRRLAQIFLNKYNTQTGRNYSLKEEKDLTDDSEEAKLTATLLHEAERYKKMLSQVDRINWSISFGGNVVDGTITLDEFNQCTRDLLDRTLELTQKVINMANDSGFNDPDEIILVGGSTRMAQVSNALKERFKKNPLLHEPDFAVALGASIYANNPDKYTNDTTRIIGTSPISNILSKTYGIITSTGDIANIIFRNEHLPIDKIVRRFAIAANNQHQIELNVYESDLLESEDNLTISADQIDNTCKQVAKCLIDFNQQFAQGTPITMYIKANNEQLINIDVDVQGNKQSTRIKFSIEENPEMRQYIGGATVV